MSKEKKKKKLSKKGLKRRVSQEEQEWLAVMSPKITPEFIKALEANIPDGEIATDYRLPQGHRHLTTINGESSIREGIAADGKKVILAPLSSECTHNNVTFIGVSSLMGQYVCDECDMVISPVEYHKLKGYLHVKLIKYYEQHPEKLLPMYRDHPWIAHVYQEETADE